MDKQDIAIIESCKWFLKAFDRAWYSIDEPVSLLEKYFDIFTDWDGLTSFYIHTTEWDFTMGYTLDVDIADLQSTVNWLKNRVKNYLRLEYSIDA